MKLMMLDLETLSTRPDAAVWQIGALTFNPDLDHPDNESGEMVEHGTFLTNVSLLGDIMKGGHVDPGTVAWWQQRPPSHFGDGCSGGAALRDLFAFWERQEPDHIVANSPSFDCVIIENMARRWETSVPWSFRDYLDCRTVSFVHDLDFGPIERGEVTHDALDDCRGQARRMALQLTNIVRLGGTFDRS